MGRQGSLKMKTRSRSKKVRLVPGTGRLGKKVKRLTGPQNLGRRSNR